MMGIRGEVVREGTTEGVALDQRLEGEPRMTGTRHSRQDPVASSV